MKKKKKKTNIFDKYLINLIYSYDKYTGDIALLNDDKIDFLCEDLKTCAKKITKNNEKIRFVESFFKFAFYSLEICHGLNEFKWNTVLKMADNINEEYEICKNYYEENEKWMIDASKKEEPNTKSITEYYMERVDKNYVKMKSSNLIENKDMCDDIKNIISIYLNEYPYEVSDRIISQVEWIYDHHVEIEITDEDIEKLYEEYIKKEEKEDDREVNETLYEQIDLKFNKTLHERLKKYINDYCQVEPEIKIGFEEGLTKYFYNRGHYFGMTHRDYNKNDKLIKTPLKKRIYNKFHKVLIKNKSSFSINDLEYFCEYLNLTPNDLLLDENSQIINEWKYTNKMLNKLKKESPRINFKHRLFLDSISGNSMYLIYSYNDSPKIKFFTFTVEEDKYNNVYYNKDFYTNYEDALKNFLSCCEIEKKRLNNYWNIIDSKYDAFNYKSDRPKLYFKIVKFFNK